MKLAKKDYELVYSALQHLIEQSTLDRLIDFKKI